MPPSPYENMPSLYEYNRLPSGVIDEYNKFAMQPNQQAEYNNRVEAEINRAFATQLPLTRPTRPITKTYNLLNRKTSKYEPTYAGNN